MNSILETNNLDERSRYLRTLVVQALEAARRGHIGPSMSLIEIFRVLYDDFLKYRSDDPQWEFRDRCILSKGHGCLALYAILADKGFFSKEELLSFCNKEALLGGHPEKKIPGVEATTGALGHGLPIGVGIAIANRIKRNNSKVIVIVGDGEMNEGSIWEAALSATKHKLDNLTVVIDCNKIQCYGPTRQVLNMEPILEKWQSFGFSTLSINGHDVSELRNTLKRLPLEETKPSLILCNTIKGKGFSFAENNPEWHYKHFLSDTDIERMYSELKTSSQAYA